MLPTELFTAQFVRPRRKSFASFECYIAEGKILSRSTTESNQPASTPPSSAYMLPPLQPCPVHTLQTGDLQFHQASPSEDTTERPDRDVDTPPLALLPEGLPPFQCISHPTEEELLLF